MLRSDRVLYFPAPQRQPGTNGRPPGTAGRVRARRSRVLARPGGDHATADHPVRDRGTAGVGPAASPADLRAGLGDRRRRAAGHRGHPHPAAGRSPAWRPHPGTRCGCGAPARGPAGEVDRAWQAFLRRFDLEHTFRVLEQVLGWTAPKLRDPAAADRLDLDLLACYAQLRLARPLAADLRLPWQRPSPSGRLTPPGSAAGSGTSTRPCPARPARRNPANPVPDGRQGQGTGARPPATTWARPSNETSPRRKPAGRRLK